MYWIIFILSIYSIVSIFIIINLLKKYERISKVTPPKTSEAKKSAEIAKTETEEDDIKETERINP